MHPAHRFVLTLGLAAVSASSFAATTVYTSSATFLTHVAPGAYTETFNSQPEAAASAYASGAFAYTVSAPGGLYGSGQFLGTSLPNEALTINFTSGNVTAIGGNFYVSNFSDAFQAVALTLTLSDGTSVALTPTSVVDSYRGFTSTLVITSLTVSAPGVSLYSGMDNLTVGITPVPEPTSALLMALGVAGLLIARRRNA